SRSSIRRHRRTHAWHHRDERASSISRHHPHLRIRASLVAGRIAEGTLRATTDDHVDPFRLAGFVVDGEGDCELAMPGTINTHVSSSLSMVRSKFAFIGFGLLVV